MKLTNLSRRDTFALGAAGVALSVLPMKRPFMERMRELNTPDTIKEFDFTKIVEQFDGLDGDVALQGFDKLCEHVRWELQQRITDPGQRNRRVEIIWLSGGRKFSDL